MKRTSKGWNTTLRAKSPKIRERDRLWTVTGKERHLYLWEKYGHPLCEFCGRSGLWHSEGLYSRGGHHIDRRKNNGSPDNCYVIHNCCHTIVTYERIDVEQEDFQGANRPDVIELFKRFEGGA